MGLAHGPMAVLQAGLAVLHPVAAIFRHILWWLENILLQVVLQGVSHLFRPGGLQNYGEVFLFPFLEGRSPVGA